MALRVECDGCLICPKLRDKRTCIGRQIDANDPERTQTALIARSRRLFATSVIALSPSIEPSDPPRPMFSSIALSFHILESKLLRIAALLESWVRPDREFVMTQAIPMVRQQISVIPSPNSSRIFGRYLGSPIQAAGSIYGDGRVVLVYEALPGQYGGVFARIVLPDDTLSPEISVDPSGYNASVAMGIDNTFVVVYQRNFGSKVGLGYPTSDRHIIIRTFNPDGSPKYFYPPSPKSLLTVDTSSAAREFGNHRSRPFLTGSLR
jgi:hypothetical protein